ncbi:MAG: glycosyltransferase family 4 protein [Verrucomicrobiota bacterium]
MKRVLFVDHVNRILGGAEVNLLELLPVFAHQQRWVPACACANHSPLSRALANFPIKQWEHQFDSALNEARFTNGLLPVLRLPAALKALGNAGGKLNEIFDKFEPHVVVSCTNKDHFCAGRTCKPRRIPSVWWVNDVLSADFFSWPVRRAFFKEAQQHAKRLVVVSEYSRRILVNGGLPEAAVRTVYNGVSVDRYQTAERGIMREMCGLSKDEPVIGLVGRITPWKGHRMFVELAKTWIEARLPGNFVIVGKPFNEDQRFEAELHRFVAKHKFEDRIHFVPFQTNVAATLRDLDVLLHTSLRPEPFGRIIIEAMAAGVTVIAARAGGVPEVITHESDGLLATPGDAADYLNCLHRVVDDATLATQLRENALKTVRARFSMEHMQQQFEQVLDEAAV